MQGKPVEEWLLHSNRIMQNNSKCRINKGGETDIMQVTQNDPKAKNEIGRACKKKIRKIKQ